MEIANRSSISVIICAYTEKRWDDIVAAVKSVHNQTLLPLEIILVIDHNTALLERARRDMPGVIIIENSALQGLSGARNCGVAMARGELVAFLDDDAEAAPDWLALISQCCKDPAVLGAGGLVVPLWPGEKPAWFPEEFYWVIGCSYQDFNGKVTRIRNAFGGNICLRREIFTTVGGFRSDIGRSEGKRLPLGGEETELCIRARQHWPEKFFLCDPGAITGHHIPLQRLNSRYFRGRCYAEGLSKAVVATYAGTKDALSSERSYTFHLLPRGILRGIHDGLRGDLAGLQRARMILVGLIMTTNGYLVARAVNVFRPRENVQDSAFTMFHGEKELMQPSAGSAESENSGISGRR